MGILVFLLVAVLVVTESGSIVTDDVRETQTIAFTDVDEGDIAQIFGVSKQINVVVEKPRLQIITPVDCYQQAELIRDLTIAYEQRSYLRTDGSTCTPVN